MKITGIINNVVDIIYPPRCPICGKILNNKKQYACPLCIKGLKYVGRIQCMKCGKQLEKEEQEYCYDCSRHTHIFDEGFAVWEYDEKIKESLYRFKYSNAREYAAFYADEIFRRYEERIQKLEPEAIIPIPLHRTRLRVRGYNQAQLVAQKLSELINIPVDDDMLLREKKTLPQKELNDRERISNLENAFQVEKNSVKYNKVLLLDDIYTTGTTMDACAKVLKDAGVKEVYFVCLCVGKGYS